MRDAFGGIVNISFIVVFMVIVNGYLAFSASYNKAFRYKNKIINIIEQNEGFDDVARSKIHEYRVSLGYSLNADINVADSICIQEDGYCYSVTSSGTTGELQKEYYTVTTAVNIDIPILNKFIPNMHIFQVNGTTKTIKKH
ncbi:MAG: hypothetical protein HFJ12_01720 [Bacilli bacterium]|nr:hypothetical protein [Bacilli bacterium]